MKSTTRVAAFLAAALGATLALATPSGAVAPTSVLPPPSADVFVTDHQRHDAPERRAGEPAAGRGLVCWVPIAHPAARTRSRCACTGRTPR